MLSYQRPRVINKIIQQFCVFIFAALAITGCFHDDDDDDDNGSKQAELMMLDFTLTGEQESPSVATDASGNGSMEINLDSGAFEVLRAGGDMSFTGGNEILINITSAQIPAENPARVVLDIDGNEGPDDLYRIRVSDSILSADGRVLDGDGDDAPGGEYQRSFTVATPGG